jgi:hypothetical protein
MTGDPVTPQTTLAIVLGASEYPYTSKLDPLKPAGNAARDFVSYLSSDTGLNLPSTNILNLFDVDESPNEIDKKISDFLKNRQASLKSKGSPARDLLLYYAGHGGFTAGDQEYFLALKTTRESREGPSSFRMVDLALTLKQDARDLRRFLILDCCFSASAFPFFQMSSAAEAIRDKAYDTLPRKGTAILCSSSKTKVSLAPKDEEYTMFSGVLLDVLRNGNPKKDLALSLEEVGSEVLEGIRLKYEDRAVRPSVISPDDREGDIADLPLFPNASRRESRVEVRLAEVERMLQSTIRDLAELREVSKNVAELNKRIDTLAAGETQTVASSPAAPDDFQTLRRMLPLPVRAELRQLSNAFFSGLVWIFVAVGLSVAYFVTLYTYGSGTFINRAIASVMWVIVALGCVVLYLAMRGKLGSFRRFPEYLPDEPPAWVALPEIEHHLGDRYIQLLSLGIKSPFFELGLLLVGMVGLFAMSLQFAAFGKAAK